MTRHNLRQMISIREWSIERFRTDRLYQFGVLLIKIVINNLVHFVFNMLIAGIGIFLSIIEFDVMRSMISPIKEVVLFFLLLTPLFLYLLSGYLLLPTKYLLTEFFSVLLFGVIGVMIWRYCIDHPTYDVLNSPWWGYVFYTIGLSMYDYLFSKSDQYDSLRILYSIIPVLLSLCGLEIKRIYNKKDIDFVIILKFIYKKIRNTTPIYL